MLTVYVDDLLLSGPFENHAGFWASLREHVNVEDPEPLDRFLGRKHEFIYDPNKCPATGPHSIETTRRSPAPIVCDADDD